MTLLGPWLVAGALSALGRIDPSILGEDPQVTVEATEVRFIEARLAETVIRGRPWVPHRRVATLNKGTRLAVRGVVQSRDQNGCRGEAWYAVWPLGYVCSEHAHPTDEPPESRPALEPREGRRLPFNYAVVRTDGTPAYSTADDAQYGIIDRSLTKNMTLVVARSLTIAGVKYLQARSGEIVARDLVGWMGEGSQWQGVAIAGATEPGPLFGWILGQDVAVRRSPDPNGEIVGTLAARTRVPLFDERDGWRQIGSHAWVERDRVNEVIAIAPPKDVVTEFRTQTIGNDQWIDVDVAEQVLVAYRGSMPVYATLVSSGRASPTPLGNYPIWAKVASIDMSNQDYEDKPYMVQGVPWVLLFQGHNALHGAYWHDRFGHRKSHGCVNLAPLDARWIFEWVTLAIPSGWTGFLPSDLQLSAVVHVRDSNKRVSFTQERPWGPPDREEEQRKLEEALARREADAQDQAEESLLSGDETILMPPILFQ